MENLVIDKTYMISVKSHDIWSTHTQSNLTYTFSNTQNADGIIDGYKITVCDPEPLISKTTQQSSN